MYRIQLHVVPHGVDRGSDGAALRVAGDDEEFSPQMRDGVLGGSHQRSLV